MDFRIGRWLTYADYCLNQGDAARCQPFWGFVAAVLGAICLVTLIAVVARMLADRKRTGKALGEAKYRRPS